MKKTIGWETPLPRHLKKFLTENKYLEKSRQKKESQAFRVDSLNLLSLNKRTFSMCLSIPLFIFPSNQKDSGGQE